MSRKVRYRCSIRQFLNQPGHHGHATIVASVEDTSRLSNEELRFRRTPAVHLSISDCQRSVKLSWDLNSPEQRKNALYKAKTLVDALAAFQDALEIEVAALNERDAEYRKQWDAL